LLSVTATCDGTTPASGTGTTTISVLPSTADLSVTVEEPVPAVVPSEGVADLSATASGSVSSEAVSWRWDDGGANGQFLPGPTLRNPRYKAPKNISGSPVTVTLTVTGECSEPTPLADQDTTSLVIQPTPHEVIVRASTEYTVLSWKSRVRLNATAEDSYGHGIASWFWNDGGAGGSFSPSERVPNPTYRSSANDTPGNSVITLSVTATCDGLEPATGTGFVLISVEPKPNLKMRAAGNSGSVLSGPGGSESFTDVPGDFWAAEAIDACREAGIISGYPDGSYCPDLPVLRDQMAVYLARALAGGDDYVPSGPPEASFSDVQPDYWAYKYIEYIAGLEIVGGLPDGGYHPAEPVNRAQMAAFIARGAAFRAGDPGLVSYQPPAQPSFTDVPADFWGYRYIEYLAEAGVVAGYDGGDYRPEEIVNRAQAAVYLDRAFGLGSD
jgi:hypothetical protein